MIAPLLVIKAPKKIVFLVTGSIASLSQATSNIFYQMMDIYFEKLKLNIIIYLTVAIFKHLSERLPDEEKDYMHDNLSWLPLVASILVVTCTGRFIERHKKENCI